MNYHVLNKKLLYLVTLSFFLQTSAMNWLDTPAAINASLAPLRSHLPSSSTVINAIPQSIKSKFPDIDWAIAFSIATALFLAAAYYGTQKYLIPTYEETIPSGSPSEQKATIASAPEKPVITSPAPPQVSAQPLPTPRGVLAGKQEEKTPSRKPYPRMSKEEKRWREARTQRLNEINAQLRPLDEAMQHRQLTPLERTEREALMQQLVDEARRKY